MNVILAKANQVKNGKKVREIQSVHFKKRYFSENKAIKWLNRFGLKHSKVDITKNYLKFRQTPPNRYNSFYIELPSPAVHIIMGVF